jgi:parallel beta-helix repeat protein
VPLSKPYPPTPVSYLDWNELADSYAGKACTILVDADGKGDFTSIQDAVDALPASGGTILVAEGTYTLSRAVVISGREAVVLSGMGAGTVLKVADKAQRSLTTTAYGGAMSVTVGDASPFLIGQHLCIRDDDHYEVNVVAGIQGNTLTFQNSLYNTYETVDNARVYTCHSAVYVTASSRRIRVTNLLVEGNRANQEFSRTGYYPSEHQGDGVRVSASCESVLLDHLWVKSAVAHGVCLGGKGHRVVSCEAWDCGYDGINAEPSCDETLIAGNYSHDQVSWNGVQFGYSTYSTGSCLITGNVLENNYQGVAAQGGSNVQIIGNTIRNSRYDGIELYSIDRFQVEGNLITGDSDMTDMTNTGIHVEQGCSVGAVTGNFIEQAAGDGVYVQDGAYIAVTGNVVRRIKKNGVKFSQTTGRDSTVSGNVVIDCDSSDTGTYSGIVVQGDRVAVTGNRVDGCDHYAIHVASTASKNVVLGNQCTVYSGSGDGAIVDEGAGTELGRHVSPLALSGSDTIVAGSTVYIGLGPQSATEASVEFAVPHACTVKKLYAHSSGAPGTGEAYTYTLRKNTADTSITCSISGSTSKDGVDIMHSVDLAAGDKIAVKVVTSSGASVQLHRATLETLTSANLNVVT